MIERQLREIVVLRRTYLRANGTEAQLPVALSDAALTAAATPLTLVIAKVKKLLGMAFGKPDRQPFAD